MKGSPMQRNFGIGVTGLSTKGSPVQWAWLASIGEAIAKAATSVGEGIGKIFTKGGAKGGAGVSFTPKPGKLFGTSLSKSGAGPGKLFGTSIGKSSSIINTPFTPQSLKVGGFKRFGSSSLSLGKTNLGLLKGVKPQNLTGIQAFIQKHVGTKGGKLITKEGLSRFAKTKTGKAAASAGLSALAGAGKGEDYRAEGVEMPQLSYASSTGTRGEDPITKASGLTYKTKRSPARIYKKSAKKLQKKY